jgi:hypothetical protein
MLHPYFAAQYREATTAFNEATHDPELTRVVAFTEQEICLVNLALILIGAMEPTSYYYSIELRSKIAEIITAQNEGASDEPPVA